MKPTAYTTQEELAYMQNDGTAFIYAELKGDHGIALYTEKDLREAVLAEREACAKLCECPIDEVQITDDCSETVYMDGFECADAIRARSNP